MFEGKEYEGNWANFNEKWKLGVTQDAVVASDDNDDTCCHNAQKHSAK
jgi:hypothetical protein